MTANYGCDTHNLAGVVAKKVYALCQILFKIWARKGKRDRLTEIRWAAFMKPAANVQVFAFYSRFSVTSMCSFF